MCFCMRRFKIKFKMNLILKWIFVSLILIVGLIGNTLGFLVFILAKNRKLPSHIIYIAMAATNIAYLTYAITESLIDIDLVNHSEYLCRFNSYVSYAVYPIANWLLSIISLDKYLSIKMMRNSKLIKSNFVQIMLVILITLYNLLLNSPILFLSSLQNHTNYLNNNSSIICKCKQFEKYDILIETIQLVNSISLPFIFIFLFTALLIYVIFKSRVHMIRLTNRVNRGKFKKDIQFAVSSIFMNFMFVLLGLPVGVYEALYSTYDTDVYTVLICLFYASFSIQFFVLFFSNSIFRNEALVVFRLKSKYSSTQARPPTNNIHTTRL